MHARVGCPAKCPDRRQHAQGARGNRDPGKTRFGQLDVHGNAARKETTMPRRVIITAPPPTSNGDLHVGHLAGPFMALDAFRRYVELRGGEVVAATYSDDNTSYVE